MGAVHGSVIEFFIFSTIILYFFSLSDVVETKKKEKKKPENGRSHFLSQYPDVWMSADQMFSAVSLSALLVVAIVSLALMILLMAAVCALLTSMKCRRKKNSRSAGRCRSDARRAPAAPEEELTQRNVLS